jgi:hypothetical protein
MLEREVVLTRIFDAPRDLEFKLMGRSAASWICGRAGRCGSSCAPRTAPTIR